MNEKKITSALISVYHKSGLNEILPQLQKLDIKIFSTGGTQTYLENLGASVSSIEGLTGYPSILDGRVKTLHPKVFGGILARREQKHQNELSNYQIPEIDLVIVDLYPFEETVRQTQNESEIIEKIDIGGISLIRAAAKNFRDVIVIPSSGQYGDLKTLLETKGGYSTIDDRKSFARKAFAISSHYDTQIHQYFNSDVCDNSSLKVSVNNREVLRYGENPHQKGFYYGSLEEMFDKLNGKAISYNNLVDIDAAVELMSEFVDERPTFAVLKHTNPCGIAIRDTIFDAWEAALAGDPVSAFGGILITNCPIDIKTAEAIDKIFYEVLIAPEFSEKAFTFLSKKKKRILLKIKEFKKPSHRIKTVLNGFIYQDNDKVNHDPEKLQVATIKQPIPKELGELLFANKCAKHLKSNTIVFTRNQQLLGMGCGQTSRVDACNQAIDKAERMGFNLEGAVMASDAFFPFPDCVKLAKKAGIHAVIQPGGSINDKLSIAFCDENDMSMVFTGIRHFKH